MMSAHAAKFQSSTDACVLALVQPPPRAPEGYTLDLHKQKKLIQNQAEAWLIELLRIDITQLPPNTKDAACSNLANGIIDHHFLFENSKIAIQAFKKVCAESSNRKENLVRILSSAAQEIKKFTGTQILNFDELKSGQIGQREALFEWFSLALENDLDRQTWLQLTSDPEHILIFGSVLKGQWQNTPLTEGDIDQLKNSIAQNWPVSYAQFKSTFGDEPTEPTQKFLETADLKLVLGYYHKNQKIDSELFGRLLNYKERITKDIASNVTPVLLEIIADEKIDFEIAAQLAKFIFQADWNKDEKSKLESFQISGKSKVLKERLIRLNLLLPALVESPSPEDLGSVSVDLKTKWLTEQLKSEPFFSHHYMSAEIVRGLKPQMIAQLLTAVAKIWSQGDFEIQRPGPIRRLIDFARQLPFTDSKWLIERRWVQIALSLSPDLQLEVQSHIVSTSLMSEFLIESKFSRQQKINLGFQYIARMPTPFPLLSVPPLIKILNLNNTDKMALAKLALRRTNYPFELGYQKEIMAGSLKITEQEAQSLLVGFNLFGALNSNNEVRQSTFAVEEIDPRNLVNAGSPFKIVFERFERLVAAHKNILTPEELAFLKQATGNTTILSGYIRVMTESDRPKIKSGQTQLSYLAEILGLQPNNFNKLKLNEERLRLLQNVVLDLDGIYGVTPLKNLNFKHEVFENFDLFLKVLRQLRSVMRLAQSDRFLYNRDLNAFNQIVRGAEIDSSLLQKWSVDLSSQIQNYIRSIFSDANFSFDQKEYEALEKQWGDLDRFLTLVVRAQTSSNSKQLISQIRDFLKSMLSNSYLNYKYERTEAKKQIEMMSDRAQEIWKTQQTTAQLVQLNSSSEELNKIRLIRLRDISKQLVQHAKEADKEFEDIAKDLAYLTMLKEKIKTAGTNAAVVIENLINDPQLNEPKKILFGLVQLVANSNSLEEYKTYAKPALAYLKAAKTQSILLEDVREIVSQLQLSQVRKGETIVVATTLVSPLSHMCLGHLVQAASCLNLDYGQFASAVFSQVMEANQGTVIGFALTPNDFENQADYKNVVEALRANTVKISLDEIAMCIHFQLESGSEIKTVDMVQPIHRQVLRVGTERDTNKGALFAERIYGPTNGASAAVASVVEIFLQNLSQQMGIEFGVPVRIMGPQSAGGTYSDSGGKFVPQGQDYLVGLPEEK